MKLYQAALSPAAIKVRAIINELAVPCELVDVAMAKQEHKSAAFLAMNPNGKVPTLDDDGFYLWESNAIMCYLAAKKPESGLLPTEPKALALTHQWLQWQATTFGPSITEVLMETIYAKMFGRQKDEQKHTAGLEKVKRDLGVLEKSLGTKEYLCGRLTVADFAIGCGLIGHEQMGFSLDAFPNVKGWAARIEARDSVKKALPKL